MKNKMSSHPNMCFARVLGQLPAIPKTNHNCNPKPIRWGEGGGAIFLGSNCPDTLLQESCSKVFGKNLQENTCTGDFFKKKNAGCRPATLFKKRLMHRFFSVKFLKLFRTAFL